MSRLKGDILNHHSIVNSNRPPQQVKEVPKVIGRKENYSRQSLKKKKYNTSGIDSNHLSSEVLKSSLQDEEQKVQHKYLMDINSINYPLNHLPTPSNIKEQSSAPHRY